MRPLFGEFLAALISESVSSATSLVEEKSVPVRLSQMPLTVERTASAKRSHPPPEDEAILSKPVATFRHSRIRLLATVACLINLTWWSIAADVSMTHVRQSLM